MRAIMMISSLAMAGAERNIVSLAPHLRASGLDLRLVTLNDHRDSTLAAEFGHTGIPRYNLDAGRMTDTAAWGRFTELLRRERIDLIHAQDQDTIIYGALAKRRLGVYTVMSRHVMEEPDDTLKERLRAQMVIMAARRGYDRIISVSEAVRQRFSTVAGVPLARIETIYNGLNVDAFRATAPHQQARAALGWEPDAPTVLMIGALRRGKGHNTLFDALPRLFQRVPDARVYLVGDGELDREVRVWAARYPNAVTLLGQRDDVPHLLAATDVLVLPSWAEALPTVLLEAGAAARPVVATDVGGTREVVIHNETGFIVPPGDANALAGRLAYLLCNPDDAAAMGQRAHERIAARFSLEGQAAHLIDLYRRIVQP